MCELFSARHVEVTISKMMRIIESAGFAFGNVAVQMSEVVALVCANVVSKRFYVFVHVERFGALHIGV